ncbi:hypothetical protein [Nocardia aobensis]|uniref:hypothetical protein n=1 Tax=Nocardia aobensis TaxID=257277 RepID=UPI0012F64C15|nr:hypothetical protein [Nocardia aobensis]
MVAFEGGEPGGGEGRATGKQILRDRCSLGVGPVPGLPTASELLRALRGLRVDGYLCQLGYDLLQAHRLCRECPERVTEVRIRRRALILDINAYAGSRLRGRRAWLRVGSDALGILIDQIACVAESAFYTLTTGDPAGDDMHAIWTRLAELENEYTDLVTDFIDTANWLDSYGIWTGGAVSTPSKESGR